MNYLAHSVRDFRRPIYYKRIISFYFVILVAVSVQHSSSAATQVRNADNAKGSPGCPSKHCICLITNSGGNQVHCSAAFKLVPRFRPSDNRTYELLNISLNNIAKLRRRDFRNIKVRTVVFDSNLAELALTRESFANLRNIVEKISLTHNRLRQLPTKLFQNSTKLKVLDLSSNEFVAGLSYGIFTGADSVESLDLSSSRLEFLPARVFSGLRSLRQLRLANNSLIYVDNRALNALVSLEEIDLSANRIRDLQPATFKRLKKLRKLNLSDNSIPALFPLMFPGLIRLEALILSGNPLIAIADQSLASMKNLRQLMLAKTKLAHLKPGMFQGLRSLAHLDLSSSQIRELGDGLFDRNLNLIKLNFDHNLLTTLNACAFPDVRLLESVSVLGNKIDCDCRLKWTSLGLRGSSRRPQIVGKCANPPMVRGENVTLFDKYMVCPAPNGANGLVPKCKHHNDVLPPSIQGIKPTRWKVVRL